MKVALVIAVLVTASAAIVVMLGTPALGIRFPAVAKADRVMRGWWRSITDRVGTAGGPRRPHQAKPEPPSPGPSTQEHEPVRLDLDARGADVRGNTP